mmetsp:Transcript_28928/g.66932  ORF Transcript_28928/g.66932 Transcript_28928/m.66932 type:complete len:206 (-) Transcript_28928:2365-2982(-)
MSSSRLTKSSGMVPRAARRSIAINSRWLNLAVLLMAAGPWSSSSLHNISSSPNIADTCMAVSMHPMSNPPSSHSITVKTQSALRCAAATSRAASRPARSEPLSNICRRTLALPRRAAQSKGVIPVSTPLSIASKPASTRAATQSCQPHSMHICRYEGPAESIIYCSPMLSIEAPPARIADSATSGQPLLIASSSRGTSWSDPSPT